MEIWADNKQIYNYNYKNSRKEIYDQLSLKLYRFISRFDSVELVNWKTDENVSWMKLKETLKKKKKIWCTHTEREVGGDQDVREIRIISLAYSKW